MAVAKVEWALLFVLYLVFLSGVCGLPDSQLTGNYAWIEQAFCKSDGHFRHIPWDCTGYLHCDAGHSHWINCPGGLEFDVKLKSCVFQSRTCMNPERAAATYCPQYRHLKFAHPKNCARYYDCNKTTPSPEYDFKVYENECIWPATFDHIKMECSNASPYCKEKPARCDYARECGPIPRVGDECSSLPDGDHADPFRMFLPNYISCSGGSVSGRYKCGDSKVFDPMRRICISNPTAAIAIYCVGNPSEKFADATSCSLYYDCSARSHHIALKSYQIECRYRHLFDLGTTSCQRFNKLSVPCGTRKESKAPGDYKVSACFNSGFCIPRKASCIGLPDGPNPYPTLENTAFVIHCDSERTLGDFDKCSVAEVFRPGDKDCGLEAPSLTTTMQIPTTTDQTPTVADETPTTTDETAKATEETTTATEDTSTATEETTTAREDTSKATKETSTVTQETTRVTEETPTATEQPPTATTTTRAVNTATTPETQSWTTTDAPATTTERDTGSRSDCNIPPVCAAELEGLKDDIASLFAETKLLTEKVNETLPGPFECVTPPTTDNSKLRISYTSTAALATSTCDVGFAVCGGTVDSTCTTENQWSSTSGTCVQYLWTQFGHPVQTMTYNCPVKTNTVITISGRYTGKSISFMLSEPNGGKLDVEMSEQVVKHHGDHGIMQWKIELSGKFYRDRNCPYNTWSRSHLVLRHKEISPVSKVLLNGNHIRAKIGVNFDNSDSISLNIHGGFKLERVEFHPNGLPSDMNIETLPINLAYKRPVMASSGYQLAGRVTDGESLVEWNDRSCWASSDSDVLPMLHVDLGQTFYVTHLILTTANCTNETCGTLEQIDIFITHNDDNSEYIDDKKCAVIGAELESGQVITITCDKPLLGRFVNLISKTSATMALCELEGYGGHPGTTDWTPFKCPQPPLIPDATVKVTYTLDAAIATYTCNDAFGFCRGNNIIRCYGTRGWDETPIPCLQTTVKSTLGNSVRKTDVCPLRLGSGLELWVTPEQDTGVVRLLNKDGSKVIFMMSLDLQNAAAPIQFEEGDTVSQNPFTKAQEAHVVLTVLSGTLLVEVDGSVIHAVNIDSDLAMTADLFESSPEILLRELNIRNRMPGLYQQMAAIDDDNPVNLALTMPSKSSSNYNNLPDIAFDGGLGANYDNGGCWHSDRGDEEPWIQVDLGSQYFIKSVELSLENVCPGCGSRNVALNKHPYGSTDADSLSSPYNLVDGNSDPDITKGSCFASPGPEAWWMVDLGGPYLIKEIKLFGETTAMDKFSDMQVMVYSVNPQIDPNAEPTVCVEDTGQMTSPQTLPCSTPVMGQYLKINKTSGADPWLGLCEVEVYESLVDRLHDFDIKVYETDPATDRNPQLCNIYSGDFSVQEGSLTCGDDIAGRYVRLTAMKQQKAGDLATVCEMKVFGAIPVKKDWTPYDCPKPDLKRDAEVLVSRSQTRATATYTCKDGYSHCSGNDVVHCEGLAGWTGSPAVCEKTTFSSPEANGLGVVNLPCSLRLGQALEIIFTPTSDSGTKRKALLLEEASSGDYVIRVAIKPSASLATFSSDKGVIKDIPTYSFKVNKESRIVFTFLTEHIDVAVDGLYLAKIPHIALIDRVTCTIGRLRSVRVIPVSQTVAVERSLVENLGTKIQSVTASSTDTGSSHKLATDGMTERLASVCWIAANNDLNPFLLINFENYYYVERVVVTTRSDCAGECADRAHDIEVSAYYDVRPATGEVPQLCAFRKGVIPADTDETILCERTVRGRYIKLRGLYRRNADDQLTFCEVQIFGGEVIRNRATLQRTDPCPSDEGYLSVESPRLCFKLSAKTDVRNYVNAQAECDVGARLINIDTTEKYNYIINSLTNMGDEAYDNNENTVRMWVGLKVNAKNNFQWSGGSTYIEQWDGTEPSNSETSVEECGQILIGGFSDISCDEKRRYICEIPIPLKQ